MPKSDRQEDENMKKYQVNFIDKNGRIVATGTGYAKDELEAEVYASFEALFRGLDYCTTQVWEVE